MCSFAFISDAICLFMRGHLWRKINAFLKIEYIRNLPIFLHKFFTEFAWDMSLWHKPCLIKVICILVVVWWLWNFAFFKRNTQLSQKIIMAEDSTLNYLRRIICSGISSFTHECSIKWWKEISPDCNSVKPMTILPIKWVCIPLMWKGPYST